MLDDRFGLPLSTDSVRAVEAYREAVDLMLSLNLGAEALLEEAIRLDPEFALAHIAQARLFQGAAQGPTALKAARFARQMSTKLTERERYHIEIIALGIEGRGGEAFALLKSHLLTYPCDALPLSLALGVYGFIGFSGRVDHHEVQRDLLEGVADDWGQDWWFRTFLGWAYVETGNHVQGIKLLDQSLEGNPKNAHAAHARAHGYYEVGEANDGIKFLTDWLPSYDKQSPLHCHLSWHLALSALQLGDVAQAMAIYEHSIQPSAAYSVPMFTLIDNAAFLWRGLIYGHLFPENIPREIADYALKHFSTAGLPFVNIHIILALAADNNDRELQRYLNEVRQAVTGRNQPLESTVRELCEGIAAFGQQNYGETVEWLAKIQQDLDCVGGSHAQRDVIVDTLIVAYLRSNQPEQAEAVMKDRFRKRTAHLDQKWFAHISHENLHY